MSSEHPAYAPSGVWHSFTFFFRVTETSQHGSGQLVGPKIRDNPVSSQMTLMDNNINYYIQFAQHCVAADDRKTLTQILTRCKILRRTEPKHDYQSHQTSSHSTLA